MIRERVKRWREQGWPGVTRTTHDLLSYWCREGREQRLFFAQIEAAETISFLTEARADFRQGLEIPRDEPSDEAKAHGFMGFVRYACKMATGSGKTTVMGLGPVSGVGAGSGPAATGFLILLAASFCWPPIPRPALRL